MQEQNRILEPDILSPNDDIVFKTIMLSSERVLKSVISSFLGIDIESVRVVGNETPATADDKKQERFDVNCVTSDGQQIEIEMQNFPMTGDSAKNAHLNITARSIYNLCDLFASQPGEGVLYKDLKRTFQIMICDYTIFPKRANFINIVQMRFADGELLNNYINSVFVELSKLEEVLKKPVQNMTNADKWALFLEYADDPKYQEIINSIATEKEEIMEAVQILTSISKDENERIRYRERRKARMDLQHNLLASFAEGEKQKAHNIARSLKEENIPLSIIVKTTGLSADEITALS